MLSPIEHFQDDKDREESYSPRGKASGNEVGAVYVGGVAGGSSLWRQKHPVTGFVVTGIYYTDCSYVTVLVFTL